MTQQSPYTFAAPSAGPLIFSAPDSDNGDTISWAMFGPAAFGGLLCLGSLLLPWLYVDGVFFSLSLSPLQMLDLGRNTDGYAFFGLLIIGIGLITGVAAIAGGAAGGVGSTIGNKTMARAAAVVVAVAGLGLLMLCAAFTLYMVSADIYARDGGVAISIGTIISGFASLLMLGCGIAAMIRSFTKRDPVVVLPAGY